MRRSLHAGAERRATQPAPMVAGRVVRQDGSPCCVYPNRVPTRMRVSALWPGKSHQASDLPRPFVHPSAYTESNTNDGRFWAPRRHTSSTEDCHQTIERRICLVVFLSSFAAVLASGEIGSLHSEKPNRETLRGNARGMSFPLRLRQDTCGELRLVCLQVGQWRPRVHPAYVSLGHEPPDNHLSEQHPGGPSLFGRMLLFSLRHVCPQRRSPGRPWLPTPLSH
jgi:hypothetical protein